METKFLNVKSAILITMFLILTILSNAQSERTVISKYMQKLPSFNMMGTGKNGKLRMTAVYINMDKLGNITGKIKVTGDYTRGIEEGKSQWNNVWIYYSKGDSGKFDSGSKKDYMEGFKYTPSDNMLKESAFAAFPKGVENVYARNLIWDMLAVEDFAWKYCDSLRMNNPFNLVKSGNSFQMAGIGDYSQNIIQLEWSGISDIRNELCANIEYRALYNKLNISMEQIKSKGTEQYWGNTRISLKTGQIVSAEMYSSTNQEAEVQGFKDKFLIKTIREISIEEIR
jgi:hypothetical protein